MGTFLGVIHQSVPHLIHHPVQAELGVDRGSFFVAAQASHDQLMGKDVQRRPVKYLSNAVGTFQDLRLARMLAVSLRHQFRPVRRDEAVGGLLGQSQDAVDAGKGRWFRRVAGYGHAPLLVPGLHGKRMGIDAVRVTVRVAVHRDVLFAGESFLCHVVSPVLPVRSLRIGPGPVFSRNSVPYVRSGRSEAPCSVPRNRRNSLPRGPAGPCSSPVPSARPSSCLGRR